jgi:hypothetical protein
MVSAAVGTGRDYTPSPQPRQAAVRAENVRQGQKHLIFFLYKT